MIFTEPFIWRKNHYAYHITHSNAMLKIMQQGLIPQIGVRSQSVHDGNRAIYFFDSLFSVKDWIDRLYESKDKESLELLRFDLMNRKWGVQNQSIGDFYLFNRVKANQISYLKISDKNNEHVGLTKIEEALFSNESSYYKTEWESVLTYQLIHKK